MLIYFNCAQFCTANGLCVADEMPFLRTRKLISKVPTRWNMKKKTQNKTNANGKEAKKNVEKWEKSEDRRKNSHEKKEVWEIASPLECAPFEKRKIEKSKLNLQPFWLKMHHFHCIYVLMRYYCAVLGLGLRLGWAQLKRDPSRAIEPLRDATFMQMKYTSPQIMSLNLSLGNFINYLCCCYWWCITPCG